MQPVSIDSDFNTDVAAESWHSTGSGSICGSGSGSGKPLPDDEHSATLIVCPLSVLSNWTVST